MLWYFAVLPTTGYLDVQRLQNRIVAARAEGRLEANVILWLEHHPVFTLGRHGGEEHLAVSREFLNQRQIPVLPSERGGSITFHAPGQLVVYPVIHLSQTGAGVPQYVHLLEEVMMQTARDFDVPAVRSPINPGIYAGGRKLGSVGIAIRHGIAFHGFALNSSVSLDPFQWISPCGLKNTEVTSLEKETSSPVSMEVVRTSAQRHFCRLFRISPVPIEIKKLELMVAKPTL